MVLRASYPDRPRKFSIEQQYQDLSPEDRFIFDRIRQDQQKYHQFLSDLAEWNESNHAYLAYQKPGRYGKYMYLASYLQQHAEQYVGVILATRAIVRDILQGPGDSGEWGDVEDDWSDGPMVRKPR